MFPIGSIHFENLRTHLENSMHDRSDHHAEGRLPSFQFARDYLFVGIWNFELGSRFRHMRANFEAIEEPPFIRIATPSFAHRLVAGRRERGPTRALMKILQV